MRKALFTLAFLALGVNGAAAQGNKLPTKKQAPASTHQAGQKQAYLGVGVEALPAALSSQMSIIPRGEGVLVEQVAKDSPAAKAGLQPHDILLNYGGKKLHSPEELVKLVRADKSGQAVALSYVRGGKLATCKVTLAERETPPVPEHVRVFRLRPDERLREVFEEFESKNGKTMWESFDAMKLARIDDQHWRAEIDYRSSGGKKEHKAFEGTRDEIRKAIRAEKDLPANERTHLLRALNLDEPVFHFHFPSFDNMRKDFWDQP